MIKKLKGLIQSFLKDCLESFPYGDFFCSNEKISEAELKKIKKLLETDD